ncbi:MAG: hypothetical protein BWY78_01309 [Alphaproteobacteria bacterium ADurb.Bin438]|nr:MAG: hypothetical protein BWY78_01309 [Alphaproteobacteria bacterium ADurb.Bin438]
MGLPVITEITLDKKKFIGIELKEGLSIKDFKQELMLIKGVYARSNNDMSVYLDKHLKEVGSCLGL